MFDFPGAKEGGLGTKYWHRHPILEKIILNNRIQHNCFKLFSTNKITQQKNRKKTNKTKQKWNRRTRKVDIHDHMISGNL